MLAKIYKENTELMNAFTKKVSDIFMSEEMRVDGLSIQPTLTAEGKLTAFFIPLYSRKGQRSDRHYIMSDLPSGNKFLDSDDIEMQEISGPGFNTCIRNFKGIKIGIPGRQLAFDDLINHVLWHNQTASLEHLFVIYVNDVALRSFLGATIPRRKYLAHLETMMLQIIKDVMQEN